MKKYKDSTDLFAYSYTDDFDKQKEVMSVLDFYYKDIKDKAQSLEYFEIAIGDIFRISMRHMRIYSKIRKTIAQIRLLNKTIPNFKDKPEYESMVEERLIHYRLLKKLMHLRNLAALVRKYKIIKLKGMMRKGYRIKYIDWFKDVLNE